MKRNDFQHWVRSIPDFPKKGVLFRDITPLLADKKMFKACIQALAKKIKGKVDVVASIESRGFIFGAALAYELGVGFVPIRKKGKLPFKTYTASYDLEYGKAEIEVHTDAICDGDRVILIDDVLATGGTMLAAIKLIKKLGGNIQSTVFLIELLFLKGRTKLKGYQVISLIKY